MLFYFSSFIYFFFLISNINFSGRLRERKRGNEEESLQAVSCRRCILPGRESQGREKRREFLGIYTDSAQSEPVQEKQLEERDISPGGLKSSCKPGKSCRMAYPRASSRLMQQ